MSMLEDDVEENKDVRTGEDCLIVNLARTSRTAALRQSSSL